MASAPTPLRFYGRRKGRPMNAARNAALGQLSSVAITLPPSGPLNPADLLPNKAAYRLEIGFGSGEHLLAEAAANPDIAFLGAEPFQNGLAAIMVGIQQHQLKNIRIYPDDARTLLDCLAPASLDMIYILFNDPWPKARHANRRFVSPENLRRLNRALKTGGHLRMATDDPGLQAWTEEQMGAQDYFKAAPGLYKERPAWPQTRYESKAVLAGRACRYYEWEKR